MILIPFFTFSQNTPLDELFDKYSGKEGITSVYITSYMFGMFADMETNDPEFDELVKNLKGIKIWLQTKRIRVVLISIKRLSINYQ